MKITILSCDGCGRGIDDDVKVSSYRIKRGKEMDPSGNGYNILWDYIDWCHGCYLRNSSILGELNIQKMC
jgi:hypothetical protein